MQLGFNLEFDDLNNLSGLMKLDRLFINFLDQYHPTAAITLYNYRQTPNKVTDHSISDLIISIAPILDDFLSELFHIESEIGSIRRAANDFNVIYECKRKFVQRYAIKKYDQNSVNTLDIISITHDLENLLPGKITNELFACQVIKWLADTDQFSEQLDLAAKYAAFKVYNEVDDVLFSKPDPIDRDNLINNRELHKYHKLIRFGFDYFAPELSQDNALNHAHYCIYCHHRNKDSCSKGLGLVTHTKSSEQQDGCPLRQKISEMNQVKAQGFNLAALAIIIIDNPLVAATGHRICNDCTKACIYQKQQPVDIPLIESNILMEVLDLPYGLEIYLLLCRWNPLKITKFLPSKPLNYNVLVVGLGPAGFGISHYLLNEGCNIVAIDGLKISPLNFDAKLPIKNWSKHKQSLSKRLPQGFGGVSEYGITARWDKNNLLILRLILERHNNFKIYSGVSLGNNITISQALALGFDHIAVCTGAREPKIPIFENFLAKGIQAAASFLMLLQNGGAHIQDTNAALLIRLPIAIIGCGLTAVDSAVEALNYYPLQVERFLSNHEQLLNKFTKQQIEQNWTEEDKAIANEFIAHAKILRTAKDARRVRQIVIEDFGGATIYYRGDIKYSQAYRINHQEILYAMSSGVKFISNMTPVKANIDKFGHINSLDFGLNTVNTRTVLIATGTEHKINYTKNNSISYYGDCDPKYTGSVVKALASAKYGYTNIIHHLQKNLPQFADDFQLFSSKLDDLLISRIEKISVLSEDVVELVVRSLQAARNFQPGQFFRLQNYSNDPKQILEPMALTGAWIDKNLGLISLIILDVGKSSRLCTYLSQNDEIVLMGPTGKPSQIVEDADVLLISTGINNILLLPIIRMLKENDCRVTLVAGYSANNKQLCHDKIEAEADIIIWCSEQDIICRNRIQDHTLLGTVADGLQYYYDNKIQIPDRIICAGSELMIENISLTCNALFPEAIIICNINSLMQCMMRGICGQCVQQSLDSNGYIFSCACQYQENKLINFNNLKSRLSQNSLLEKLSVLL